MVQLGYKFKMTPRYTIKYSTLSLWFKGKVKARGRNLWVFGIKVI